MRALRPYQEVAVRSVHEAWTIYRAPLLVLATGTGKTFTAASILAERAKLGRILWFAHRRELITQAKDALESVGLTCEIEMAQDWANLHAGLFSRGAQCVIASVQTLQGTRLRRFQRDAFATIVIDEAHHATAKSYRDILDWFPEARVLGLTATPDRGDGVGLGAVFDVPAYEYGIREAIRDGYLSPIMQRTIECADLDLSDVKTVAGDLAQGALEKAMTLDAVLHQVAKPLVDAAGNVSTIVFTAGVEQAHAMVGVMGGYTDAKCEAIDGTTPDSERSRILREYAEGKVQYLFNCAVLTEGFDAPRTSCIAIARPTKSRALYTQMIGRGTRLYEGKSHCLVLDFVGNAGRHTLISPLDVLAGKPIDDEVREAAEAKVKAGMPSEDALAAAEAEHMARKEREERERARAAKIRADVAYRSRVVDPFGAIGNDTGNGPRATSRQVEALTNLGVKGADTLSVGAASKLLDTIAQRRKAGLATYKQSAQLAKHGLSVDLPFAEARAAMDALAANRWTCTPEMRARWGVKQAAE